MSDENGLAIIGASPLGPDLTDDEKRTLLQVMHERRLGDQDILVEEGAIDNALHLLASGRLAVIKHVIGGEATLHVMKPGELAGAMGFVDGMQRNSTLRADGEAVVYSLEREAFETLVDREPRMVYHIMRAVTRTAHGVMLGLNQQVEELTNYIIKQHGRY